MNCPEIAAANFLAGEICQILSEECGPETPNFTSPQDVFDTAICYAENEFYYAVQNYASSNFTNYQVPPLLSRLAEVGLVIPNLFTDLDASTDQDLALIRRFFEIYEILDLAIRFFHQMDPSLIPGSPLYNSMLAQGLFEMVTSTDGFGIRQEDLSNQPARQATRVFQEREHIGADCANLNSFYRGALLLAGIPSTILDVEIDRSGRDFRQENIRHECVAVYLDASNLSNYIQADLRYNFFGGPDAHQQVRLLRPYEKISHYHHDRSIHLPRTEAISELDQALIYDSNNIAALFNLGVLTLWQENPNCAQLQLAENYFDQILELAPGHLPTLRQLSYLYLRQQQYCTRP
ncbi:MAG: hypothetical protein ABH859_04990 [Pseudomonadota bacterium]